MGQEALRQRVVKAVRQGMSQTEAGRLCNEVAGYYKPIDEAADAGKKAETEAIYKKMVTAVEKLKALAK